MTSAEAARWAEQNNPGWCVLWGEYHQTFTAWAMWTSALITVEAATMEELTIAMRTEESRVPAGRGHFSAVQPWR